MIQIFKWLGTNKIIIIFTEVYLNNIKIHFKVELKATLNFLICSCVKNTESIPYKSNYWFLFTI